MMGKFIGNLENVSMEKNCEIVNMINRIVMNKEEYEQVYS
jgi:hypothetical protein